MPLLVFLLVGFCSFFVREEKLVGFIFFIADFFYPG
jgi:hypothetical protein